VFVCDIRALPLVPGDYKLSVGLDIASREVDWVENAVQITITGSDYYGTGVVPTRGAFLLGNRWRLGDPGRDCVSDETSLRRKDLLAHERTPARRISLIGGASLAGRLSFMGGACGKIP
jgi:hypothetical protein